MAKICAYGNCKNTCFGGGYCLFHQRHRTEQTGTPTSRALPKEETTTKKRTASPGSFKKKVASLMDKADAIFSLYVRTKDADANGFVYCFTCSAFLHWKKLQCGHFNKRGHMATRYEPDNARPQCKTCNEYKGGMTIEFRRRLVGEIGEARVLELETEGRTVSDEKANDGFFKEIITKFGKLVALFK